MKYQNAKSSIIVKSMLRRPHKALLLIGIIALISFSFSIRAFEGLIVENQLAHFATQYHAAARVVPLDGWEWYVADVQAELEEIPLVDYVDSLRVIQGVMEDVYSSDYGGFNPFINKMFVYGTLVEKERFVVSDFFNEENWNRLAEEWGARMFPYLTLPYLTFYIFTISIDSVVAALPEHAQEGDILHFTFIDYRNINDHVYEQAKVGQRYFLAGQFTNNMGHIIANIPSRLPEFTEVWQAPMSSFYILTLHPLNQKEDMFLYPIGEHGQVGTVPALERAEEEIDILRNNIHTIFLRTTKDLTANPLTGSLDQSSVYLLEGRFINWQDYEDKNAVAVIRAEFATLRGLEIGDTLEVTMRESPFAKEYIMPDASRHFPVRMIGERVTIDNPWGMKDWNPFTDAIEYDGVYYIGWRRLDFTGNYDEIGNLEIATGYITDRETIFNRSRSEQIHDWRDMETQTVTLEIVGIYGVIDDLDKRQTLLYNNVFVPDSIVPAQWTQDVLYRNLSFVLTHPKYEEEFLYYYESFFVEHGFWPIFQEHGWESFDDTVTPIRSAIMVGILTSAALLLLVFLMITGVYILQWRKEYAIIRALGLKRERANNNLFFPAIAIGC